MTSSRRPPRARIALAAAGIAVLVAGIAGLAALLSGRPGAPGASRPTTAGPTGTATPSTGIPTQGTGTPTPSAGAPSAVPTVGLAGPLPASDPVTCPAATRTVRTADELSAALAAARAGDSIRLVPGSYTGRFVATGSGSAAEPIFLCGPIGAVLEGDGVDGGYVLHLDGARNWRLVGFSVRGGQKGVMADATSDSVIQGLTVEDIGDEGIHLRAGSSGNAVIDNTIRRTGLRKDKFGEGVYVGSAESNWCDTNACRPDRSDRNVIRGNTISETTAESVDLKEGSSGGLVVGNSFDGSALRGADSWIDAKGNAWLIEGNRGQHSPMDGFQTHEVVDGWGTGNVFRRNSAAVDGPGYGYALTPVAGNTVACDNTAQQAAKGLSNTDCR